MSSRPLRAIALAVVVWLGGVRLFPAWPTPQTEYRLAKVDRGDIVAIVNATGTINPITTVIVGSQLSGQVVEILADYNDQVKAGQVVARLNSDQIHFQLDAAKADLAEMRATQTVREVEAADAERVYQRQSALRTTGATSEASFDAARTKAESARAQLQVVAAQIHAARGGPAPDRS